MEASSRFEQWALVELLGHNRIVGLVTEVELFGAKMCRVDVPETELRQALTKFYGPSAIYAITPLTEETGRKMAEQSNSAAPLTIWDARQLLKPRQTDDEYQASLTAGMIPDDEGGL